MFALLDYIIVDISLVSCRTWNLACSDYENKVAALLFDFVVVSFCVPLSSHSILACVYVYDPCDFGD